MLFSKKLRFLLLFSAFVCGVLVVFLCHYFGVFNPKVSVVLPTYNRAQLLVRAIDSVLNQTYQDFELIVVDDASTDETASVLQKYEKLSSKIKVIRLKENQGVSVARNLGNEAAQGKYIAILDSDDIFKPHYLETAVHFMETHPTVTIGVPIRTGYYENKESPLLAQPEFYFNFPIYDFFEGNSMGNLGIIFKRNFMKKHKVRYKNEYTCGEDYDFWVQMIVKGAQIAQIESEGALVVFRHCGGLSATGNCQASMYKAKTFLREKIGYFSNTMPVDFCDALKKLLALFPNVFLDSEKENALNRCPLPTEPCFKIQHSVWSDYVCFDQNLLDVYRKQNNDKAQLLVYEPKKKIKLKWYKWGEEEFVYNPQNGVYVFKGDEPDTKK